MREALSQCHLSYGWTVVWRGTEGSCLAVKKGILDKLYPFDFPIEVHNALDPTCGQHLVLVRKVRHHESDPGPDRG